MTIQRTLLGLGLVGLLTAQGGCVEKKMDTSMNKKTGTVETKAADVHNPGADFKKPDREALKSRLTPIQFKVTQKDGTEPPFKNEYWDNKKQGIYVDVVSGEALFSSTHKYKSGTGWPSFWQPIEKGSLVDKEDRTLFLQKRTEVRSKRADSHLGHVFDDGPDPTGKRYCINSASLAFVPLEEMKSRGYEKYLHLFEEEKEK